MLIIIFSSTAMAQDDLFGLFIEELLNTKVHVASRKLESVIDSPSSVTVFTDKEIEKMGIPTLEELIEYVPSFQISNLGERRSLTVEF
jgi:outer membrane receptor for ferrienterochelin and colicin